jgi:flagellin-specific chaperone FliS
MFSATNVLPTQDSPESSKDELYDVARDLSVRATSARDMGDLEAARKYLKAALDIMVDETSPRVVSSSPEVLKIMEMLESGWQEVSQLSEATHWSVNRVHTQLTRLRAKGTNLQTQNIKRYRIVSKD